MALKRGAFDCVHTEHGKAPSVGKLTVFKTSLVFKAGSDPRPLFSST